MAENGVATKAYERALSEFDIAASEAELSARRGASKQVVIRESVGRAYTESDVTRITERALATFEALLRHEDVDGEVHEIPGAERVLGRLKDLGVAVALGLDSIGHLRSCCSSPWGGRPLRSGGDQQ